MSESMTKLTLRHEPLSVPPGDDWLASILAEHGIIASNAASEMLTRCRSAQGAIADIMAHVLSGDAEKRRGA